MKFIKNTTNCLALLLLIGFAPSSYGQEALIAKYHQVMTDFLSHDCMSFDMTTVQYGDVKGIKIQEEVTYQVVKSDDIWYLASGEYQILFSNDYLVSIDNAAQTIHFDKKPEMNPAKIFSNASGMEKVFEMLQLEGEERTVIGGKKRIAFFAPTGNETTIQLEYDEVGPVVERISATIDMMKYNELDHALDGRKIESIYNNVKIGTCLFEEKIQAIIDSEFGVLLNRNSYQGYLIN